MAALSEVVAAGIDYFTMTMRRDTDNSPLWHSLCLGYIEQRAKDNLPLQSTRRLGYEGYSMGGSFVGERDDGYICTVSGEAAQVAFSPLYERNAHYSRFDCQCTVRFLEQDAGIAKRAWRSVERGNEKIGTASQRHSVLIEDLRGGATCYVGSRKSEQFARIYNKDAESGEDRYKNCWRYEVQLKNVLATKAADRFWNSEYAQSHEAAVFVRQWLRRRGIQVPWRSEAELYPLPTVESGQSDVERQLEWLKTSVRPALRRLLKLDLYDTILETLGLSERPRFK